MLSEKPWRGEAVMQFCAAQAACLCLGVAAIGLLQKLEVRGFRQEESLGNIMVGTLCFQGAAWLLILFFLKLHQVTWSAAFGFRGPRLKRALLMAILFIIIVLPIVLWLQGESAYVLKKMNFQTKSQTAVKLLTDATSPLTVIYLGAFAIVIAPVAEEFIFRGMLFPFFKRFRCSVLAQFLRHNGWPKLAWLVRQRMGRVFAWFGVSFFFALIHNNAQTFVPLFVFALALTWLYEKTDNLLAPITAHALFNATNYAVLLWQNQHAIA